MKFRTSIEKTKSAVDIDHDSKIIMLGSCFSENIGSKLKEVKFDCSINPLGIAYNPISIQKHLKYAAGSDRILDEGFVENQGVFNHLDFHSSLSGDSFEKNKVQISSAMMAFAQALKNAHIVFITYGTAFVFEYDSIGVVNNCHKLNPSKFRRRLLSYQEIELAINRTVVALKELAPKAKIVMTLSPIRHIRDGLIENQRSKAALLTGLTNVINEKHVEYFPSYEIMLDDLRDYRFYERDLIHPTPTAIDYIWSHFKETYLTTKALSVIDKVEKINSGLQHRPRFPKSKAYQLHLENLKLKMEELPSLDFKQETKRVLNQLNSF